MTTVEAVNAAALALFVLGLVLGVGSTGFRVIQLWMRGHNRPQLIYRDLAVFGLLCFTFLLIGIARVLGWQIMTWPDGARLAWTVLTAAPAVAAVWVYVYFEFRVIGHRRDR